MRRWWLVLRDVLGWCADAAEQRMGTAVGDGHG